MPANGGLLEESAATEDADPHEDRRSDEHGEREDAERDCGPNEIGQQCCGDTEGGRQPEEPESAERRACSRRQVSSSRVEDVAIPTRDDERVHDCPGEYSGWGACRRKTGEAAERRSSTW